MTKRHFILAARIDGGEPRAIAIHSPIMPRASASACAKVSHVPEGDGLWLWESDDAFGARGSWRRLTYAEAIAFAGGSLPWTSIDAHIAYTLGTESDYDSALERHESVNKLRGGSVWRSAAEAMSRRDLPGNEAMAVYEVALPGPWCEVTEPQGDWHALTADAPLIRKVS